jgi:hypothetical protein
LADLAAKRTTPKKSKAVRKRVESIELKGHILISQAIQMKAGRWLQLVPEVPSLVAGTNKVPPQRARLIRSGVPMENIEDEDDDNMTLADLKASKPQRPNGQNSNQKQAARAGLVFETDFGFISAEKEEEGDGEEEDDDDMKLSDMIKKKPAPRAKATPNPKTPAAAKPKPPTKSRKVVSESSL